MKHVITEYKNGTTKEIDIKYFCDRCGDEFGKRNAHIIENLTYNSNGYSDRGSGGSKVSNKEFCAPCTAEFHAWITKPSEVFVSKEEFNKIQNQNAQDELNVRPESEVKNVKTD